MNRLRSLLLAALASSPATALALDPGTTDANAIMEAVEARDTGAQSVSRLEITIRDAGGRERSRVVQTKAMKVDDGRKQLFLFESPADVRNAGFLSFDHATGADDQWLYLPSLGKTTRIASTDKSGAFMGTDLSYADLTEKDPANYSYELVKDNDPVSGEDCWVIEAAPTTEEEQKETGYKKTQLWISKEKLMPLKAKSWVIQGQRMKWITFGDVKNVGGVWVAHETVVKTTRNGELESQSTLRFSSLDIGDALVSEDDFTERRLEQGL